MNPIKTLFRKDGWSSLLSGLAGAKDKLEHTQVSAPHQQTDIDCTNLYMGDGVAATAIDLVGEDIVQSGFEVAGDDGKLYNEFTALGLNAAIQKAWSAKRLYGGALLVVDMEGQPFDTPLDLKRGNRIRGFKVYPRSRVKWEPLDFVADPASPYFENFELFKVYHMDRSTTFTIHASRCFVIHGVEFADPTNAPGFTPETRWWGCSELPRSFHALASYGSFMQGLGNLGQELVVGKYKLSNLEQLVAESNWTAMDARLGAIDMQKSILHGVFLGDGEDYTRDSVSLGGIGEGIDRLMMWVSSVFRIPVSKLFGRSAAGMNATGEGDEKNYNRYLGNVQRNQLMPILVRLVEIVNSYLHVLELKPGERPSITFNALYLPTDQEIATTRNLVADADTKYINSGVLSPDEVRDNRFVGGYSLETSVEGTIAPDLSLGNGEEG